eukprot:8657675-Pyramimonas_sp.AAC.1
MPWGVKDRGQFSDKDHVALRRGNRLMKATLRLTRVSNRYHIPWFLEDPYSSMMWKIPALRKLASAPHCEEATVDFCSRGTRWRKRAHLLFG